MSIRAMTWVFDSSPYAGGSRLVHLALADKANDHNDYELWLHQSKIAEMARLSVNQVGRILKQMVEDGYLILLEQGGGRGRASRYQLVLKTPQNGSVSEPETPPFEAVKPTIEDPENPPFANPRLLLTKEGTEENATPTPATATFAAFYATYPRKVERLKAERAWTKAVTRARPEDIIAGAARYRDDPNREPQFTKHPATWLNGGCWTDEPLPPRHGRTHPLRNRHATTIHEDLAVALGAS